MRSLLCLLTLLLLVSCKSTKLTPINTGSDPTWAGEEQYEVLVAVLLYNPELRVQFEQKMTAELKKEGIKAVPSFSVMPKVTSLNAATFSKFLSTNSTLAVYFAQATSVVKEESNSNKEAESSLFSDLLGGAQWDTTFVANMESALYVHGQTSAVWWNRVRLEAEEKKVTGLADRYIGNEIKAMKQGGAISRLK